MTALGRRISAAAVLAGVDQESVAGELGISVRTLRRSLNGKRDFTDREIGLLRELLSVPDWFLRRGFAGAPDQANANGLVAELRDEASRQHSEVLDAIAQLAEQMRVLSADRGLSRR